MSKYLSILDEMEHLMMGPCLAVIRDESGEDCQYIRGSSVEELRETYDRMQQMGGFFNVDKSFVIYENGIEVESIDIDAD